MDLQQLNSAQRDAVLAPHGPILIVAGAGSGKTRVLTYRIARVLFEGQADSNRLLAVTFTNKAAAEMRDRVSALLGESVPPPWISTFHSACARILRQEIPALGYNRNFTIFDEADSLSALKRLLEEGGFSGSVTVEAARSRIEQAKNDALGPEEFAASAASPQELKLAEVYRLYQARLKSLNALDFGDLLLLTYTILAAEPAILARWQGRAEQLLVDEYQDTNRVQYLLLKLLSSGSGNLCVVGDEDQSIYRWRGADIRNILEFERDFPDAQIFKLEQNYRSTKTILAAADGVIQNNRERKPKRLWTENAEGEPITYYTGVTERDEADFIAREIGRMASNNTPFREIVIFYRTNGQSRVLEEAMMRRRVPYAVVGGIRFYERREVKDLLAYLRAIANPADAISVERMIQVPPRGVGAKTIEALRNAARAEEMTLFEAMGRAEGESTISLRIAKQVTSLRAWLSAHAARLSETPVRALLDEIIAKTSFLAWVDSLEHSEERRENVAELLSAASAFDSEQGPGKLQDFLERVALVSDQDQIESDGRVALMTLHTSKGLEYPVVFITGMEEGIFPHSRSQDSGAEIEEERRLCYVGMTRAGRQLYLTNTLSREIYGLRQESRPSRFMHEIDSALIRRIAPEEPSERPTRINVPWNEPRVDYSDSQLDPDEMIGGLGPGTRVVHPAFGEGIVRRKEGRGDSAKAWVHFQRSGLKLLVLKFANLKAIDG